eukprot:NODE_1965_length_686_cov_78.774597_g1915_i0.p1 GENE.NODE_1965_length_686_cov_78.774597_g1915_i0~~NODE_1965_length_686_cov_78.774597_g1915_i0.p1  ORF type:complete len:158 (+),score=29.38 NODE_1965_length_686_cov_78.774597_g1915_i0:81-554(+)
MSNGLGSEDDLRQLLRNKLSERIQQETEVTDREIQVGDLLRQSESNIKTLCTQQHQQKTSLEQALEWIKKQTEDIDGKLEQPRVDNLLELTVDELVQPVGDVQQQYVEAPAEDQALEDLMHIQCGIKEFVTAMRETARKRFYAKATIAKIEREAHPS